MNYYRAMDALATLALAMPGQASHMRMRSGKINRIRTKRMLRTFFVKNSAMALLFLTLADSPLFSFLRTSLLHCNLMHEEDRRGT